MFLKAGFSRLLFSLVVCGSLSTYAETSSEDFHELKILADVYMPFAYQDKQQLTGYGVDVVRELVSRLGGEQHIELVSWSEAYHRLLSEELVAHFPMGRTLSREQQFRWVGPIIVVDFSLFINPSRETDWPGLANKPGGCVVGFATCELMMEMGYTQQTLKKYQNLHQLYNRFAKGEISAFLDSRASLAKRLAHYEVELQASPVKTLSAQGNYYLAFSLATPQSLVDQVQSALQAMRDEGVLLRMQERYFDPSGVVR